MDGSRGGDGREEKAVGLSPTVRGRSESVPQPLAALPLIARAHASARDGPACARQITPLVSPAATERKLSRTDPFPSLKHLQLHLPVCATSTLPSRPHYAKRRDGAEPFSVSLSCLRATVPQTCSVGKTAVVSMRVPAVAAVAVPSSAPAQPPGRFRSALSGGRRAERRPRSALPHTAPVSHGHAAAGGAGDKWSRGPAAARPQPRGVRGRQSRGSPGPGLENPWEGRERGARAARVRVRTSHAVLRLRKHTAGLVLRFKMIYFL